VTATRAVVYLTEDFVPCLAYCTSQIRRVGFRPDVIASVLQLENRVVTVRIFTPRNADVGVDLSVFAQPALDLGEVSLDSGDIVGVEVVAGGRHLYLHQRTPGVVGPLRGSFISGAS
jgi:hypothetical protein